jgi:hypothetical protein
VSARRRKEGRKVLPPDLAHQYVVEVEATGAGEAFTLAAGGGGGPRGEGVAGPDALAGGAVEPLARFQLAEPTAELTAARLSRPSTSIERRGAMVRV